jgi:hypothetical protein
MDHPDDARREAGLRRRAHGLGLAVQKNRSRLAQRPDYGGYRILDPVHNRVVAGGAPWEFSLDLASADEALDAFDPTSAIASMTMAELRSLLAKTEHDLLSDEITATQARYIAHRVGWRFEQARASLGTYRLTGEYFQVYKALEGVRILAHPSSGAPSDDD